MRLVLLLYWYYFNRCSPELAELVSLPCCLVMLRAYKKNFCYNFSMSQTPFECQKDVYTSSFISRIARFYNSFLADCNPIWFVIKTKYLKSPFRAENTVLKRNSTLQRTCLPFSRKPIFLNWNSLHHSIQDWKAIAGQGVTRQRTQRREAYRKPD